MTSHAAHIHRKAATGRAYRSARPLLTPDRAALQALQEIPGIGKSLSRDLLALGIRRVDDLRGKNPRRLYEQLNALSPAVQDPCVLYTFRCAVYFATARHPRPEKLRWWYWKDRTYNE